MSDEVKYCKRGHPRTPENVGNDGNCLMCRRITRERWRLNNPEKIKECLKKYGKSEKHKKCTKRWREENKEKVKEIRVIYFNKNKDAIREKNRKRAKENYILNREKIIQKRKKDISDLTKHYVCGVMRVSVKDIPVEVVQLKRLALQLKREVKNANIH